MNTLTLNIHAVPFRMPDSLAEVRLFSTDVTDYTHADLAKLNELLSDEECAKVKRYRQKKDKLLSVVARGNLRRLLGKQLRQSPQSLIIGKGVHGKPQLENTNTYVDFNVSHAGSKVLVAVDQSEERATQRESHLGIDIEKVNPLVDIQIIAKYYFSDRELYLINQSPEPATTFFIYWTRKEALLKAAGVGLVDELSKVDVSKSQTVVAPTGERASLVSGTFDLWTFTDINGYIVSLALKEVS
ncbi:MAG: 4'-phosphopantetheinyl transferase superfamily protein [Saprospiraceae bacterium]